ncbi:phosphatidic acid phosphatase type 2/haloperoxidase [Radiomyces spectabilis]|uniref:phosphatidic acid phosphatase type 2/haloperoxidase n=1 Tax=Radiomyces spectabilis TaxID=64574 RepID=UPI00221F3733|nr:phosphatidic acid phosphatase type 2/haloperoxidase [Radiomyces spectabilis]KAI8371677.1 phosphatidic acid phosphatase type 2/haloperoxidase [Radiomyces spectabilis]
MLGTDWKNPRQRRIVLSYLYDWLLVVIMTAVFFAIDVIPPFRREFSLTDKTIMFPYAHQESVPVWLLVVICFFGPILVIAGVSLGLRRSVHDFHSGILGLCLGLSITIMMTDVIKITAGRPRPDFLSRCQPVAGSVDPPLGLSNYTICATPFNTHIMKDGFKSFPSGHSSFSFSGLGYLAFYLAGKMRMFDERGHTYKGFLFAFPLIGALLVAISRTRDYRHHWHDVFIGALLGTSAAYFAYRQYHPSLAHATCHHPFAVRIGPVELQANDFERGEATDPFTDSRVAGSTNQPYEAPLSSGDNYSLHPSVSRDQRHGSGATDDLSFQSSNSTHFNRDDTTMLLQNGYDKR